MLYIENDGEIKKDKFMKVFFDKLSMLYGLSSGSKDLFLLMAKSIGLGNKNSLIMSPKRKKEYASTFEYKTYRTVDKHLKELELASVIRRLDPEDEPNKYTLNPNLVFSGNDYQRAKILVEFEKIDGEIKVFKNDIELNEYLNNKNKEI